MLLLVLRLADRTTRRDLVLLGLALVTGVWGTWAQWLQGLVTGTDVFVPVV